MPNYVRVTLSLDTETAAMLRELADHPGPGKSALVRELVRREHARKCLESHNRQHDGVATGPGTAAPPTLSEWRDPTTVLDGCVTEQNACENEGLGDGVPTPALEDLW